MLNFELDGPLNVLVKHNPFFQGLLNKVKYDTDYQSTRVLVELGKANFDLVVPFFEEALLSNKQNLQWTALRELVDLGQSNPQKVYSVLNQVFHNGYMTNTRVLIELGKKNPESVLTIFNNVLQSSNELAKWSAVLELSELVKVNQDYFVPLLVKAAQSNNPHIQWCAMLTTLELSKTQPRAAAIIIDEILNEEVELNLPLPTKLVNVNAHNLDPSLALLRLALDDRKHDLEWQAMLELIDLAKSYPDKIIPIIEHALNNHNPHVQWLAALELVELAKDYPGQVLPILRNTLKPTRLSMEEAPRVLVEYGRESLDEVVPILEQAINSGNYNLQCAAMLELVELGQLDPARMLNILDKNLHSRQFESAYEETRVLVELGCKNAQQVIMLLKQAFNHEKVALQCAAFQELIEILKVNVTPLILQEIELLNSL